MPDSTIAGWMGHNLASAHLHPSSTMGFFSLSLAHSLTLTHGWLRRLRLVDELTFGAHALPTTSSSSSSPPSSSCLLVLHHTTTLQSFPSFLLSTWSSTPWVCLSLSLSISTLLGGGCSIFVVRL